MTEDPFRRRGLGGGWRRLASSVALGLVLAAGGQAQAPAASSPQPSAETFALDFEACTTLVSQRRWPVAHEAWLELLRRHAGAEYVRPKIAEVRELVRKCAFWSVTEEPTAKQAIGLALKSYSDSSGHIELAYDSGNLSDFEPVKDDDPTKVFSIGRRPTILLHPLYFKGPYRITFVGKPFELANATVLCALKAGNGYLIQLGGAGWQHVLKRIEGTNVEAVNEWTPEVRKGKPLDSERKVHAVVRVDEKTISYSYDGKTVFQSKNEGGALGQWGLAVSSAFGTVEVEGNATPSWIDGRKDKLVQSARYHFDSGYRDPPEFDAWRKAPVDAGSESGPPTLNDSIALPPLTQAQSSFVHRVSNLRSSHQTQQALDLLGEVEDDFLPPGLVELQRAYCHVELARPGPALEHLLAAEKTGQGLPDLRLVRAILLRRLERAAEAGEVLSELVREQPGDPDSSAEFVRALMDQRRFGEARVEIERVLSLGASRRELTNLRSQLVKAVLGPEWREAFSFPAEHFVVHSDLDAKICKLAADELEDAWAKCCEWFGAVPAEAPTHAYVFSGESSYRAYIQDISRESVQGTVGVYCPVVDQVVAWNSSDRQALLHTLRHECVHRYLRRVLGEAPPWFEEGLAEHFAASKRGAKRWAEGAVLPERLLNLQLDSYRLDPLATLLLMEQDVFMRDGGLHYAEAWTFVRWLRASENVRGRELFTRLWSALSQPEDVRAALASALEGVDVSALEAEFNVHVTALLHEPMPVNGKR